MVHVFSHYPITAAQSGGQTFYFGIKRHLSCPALAVHCYDTVRNGAECAEKSIKLPVNVGAMKRFPATAHLEYIAIDILGKVARTPSVH